MKTFLTLCATAIALAALPSPALATPGSGFAPTVIINGHFGSIDEKTAGEKTGHWGMLLKTKDSSDVGTDRLSIQGGGFSGWHSHPAPVFVTVTQGSIVWYDGSNPLCVPQTYSTGQSFIEGAGVIHYVKNASASAGAEYVAIRVNPTGVVFRVDENKPTNCKF